jgi:hypothetical protein
MIAGRFELRLNSDRLGRGFAIHPRSSNSLSNSGSTHTMSKNVYVYVFDHCLFTSRRGNPPTPWYWEIRRKSKPDERSLAGAGFRSAKAAEEAGKIVLAEVREAVLQDRRENPIDKRQERLSQIARKALRAAEARANRKPMTPERRSGFARIAAHARAKALSPERRSEIGRMGGSFQR